MNAVGPEQLGCLLTAHGPALALYARQWCTTPEDVVQDALVKLAAQPAAPAEPVAWLYRVVRNGAISAARTEQRRRRHESVAAAQAAGWFVPGEAGLDAEAATSALRQLPIDQREVIVAHLWGQLTFEQIAGLVGSSSSTVHRRYLAGLTALRERLGEPCPNQLPTATSRPSPAP